MATVVQTGLVGGDADVILLNFAEQVMTRIQLRESGGHVLVLGKVVIVNSDTSDQNATARLTTVDGQVELDRVDVRIPSQGSQCLSLNGWITGADAAAGQFVDLRCSTFEGRAKKVRLNAILVDVLV